MVAKAVAAFEDSNLLGSLLAGEALTSYKFAKIHGGENVMFADAGERVDGVIVYDAISGDPVTLALNGVVGLTASGAITDGDSLASGANGVAVTTTSQNVYAIALEDAADGAEFRALLVNKNELAAISVGIETIVNTPGAISVTKRFTLIEPDGTDAMTLAAGLYNGQEKWIKQGTGANTPKAAITGVFEQNGTAGTVLTTDAAGEMVQLVWDTNVWQVFLNNGGVVLT
jgi:hypothetical protein